MLITACVFSVAAQAAPIIEKSDVVTYSVDIQDATIAPQAVAISVHYLTNPAHERWCINANPEADAQPGEISLTSFKVYVDFTFPPDRIRQFNEPTLSISSIYNRIDDGGRCCVRIV
jgi:hypothetical protein